MPSPGELIIEDQTRILIEKGTLNLTVKVETKEQADEIIEWLYSPKSLFKTELLDVSWDKQSVPTQVVDLIKQLQTVLNEVDL